MGGYVQAGLFYENFSWSELMKALDNVVTGKEESLMLMTDPPLPMAYGKVCAYMHVNRDSSQGYSKNRLHCRVSISEPDDLDECIIYNVAHVDKKWAVAFLRGLLENNQVPDISGLERSR